MSDDRNAKVKPPLGIHGAVLTLAAGLSSEAADNLIRMAREIASQYEYSDSVMIRRFTARLNRAVRNRRTAPWATEIQAKIAEATMKTKEVAV